MSSPAPGCGTTLVGLATVGATFGAVVLYCWVLAALQVDAGGAEVLGGALVLFSTALNVGRWGYRLTGDEALEKEYAGAAGFVTLFNVLFGAYAVSVLLVELRAGRDPAGGFVLTAWSGGPAVVSLFRFGRKLADRVFPAEPGPFDGPVTVEEGDGTAP